MTRSKAQEGFTLIEVLVALVVLSFAIASMMPVLLQTVRGNFFGKSTTKAATWSQDKLEELRRVDFSDPALTPGTYTDPTGVPEDGYTRTWAITNAGGLYSADIVGIEVETTWTDSQGLPHTSRAFSVRANIR